MNVARYFVPHVLTLSTSSPFWMGRETGLKSYRSIIYGSTEGVHTGPDFLGLAIVMLFSIGLLLVDRHGVVRWVRSAR